MDKMNFLNHKDNRKSKEKGTRGRPTSGSRLQQQIYRRLRQLDNENGEIEIKFPWEKQEKNLSQLSSDVKLAKKKL